MKQRNGFTLIELIAVIVILGIILAIAIPTVTGVIQNAAREGFISDAKIVLDALKYEKAKNEDFDPTTITKSNFSSALGMPSNNYQSVSVKMDGDIPFISIVGTGEWDGLIVCGTRNNMEIVSNISECIIDHEAPVITINGSNPVNINVGSTYTDDGAAATDNNDGDITSKIATTSNVSTSVVGSYTVVYSVTDSKNNITTVTRTVNVVDVTAPTVTFGTNGNATYAKTRSTTVTVTDIGGINVLKYLWNTSATTPTEATFTTTFTSGGTLSSPVGVTGAYYLWILAKDNTGNVTIIKTNAFNLDNTAPIITITGSNPVSVNVGSTYTDAGATATDANSGISGSVNATSTVVTTTLGTYTVTYNVSDNAGNTATAAVRTVNVVDITSPTVTFGTNGNAAYAKTRSTTVTVSDAGGINVLKYLWNTSTTAPTEATFTTTFTSGGTLSSPAGVTGAYYLWILAKDNTGNVTIIKTNAFNLDNTAPIITITGSNPVSVNAGSTYTDAGATATDANSGISGSVTATSTVVTTTLGTYTVTYNVSDNAGNAATAAVRTVNVVDGNAPIVTANSASYTITQGASNAFPGTYFTISQNGLASISSTVCVDTSNSNVTVTNTSSLGVGSHVIKCTATKTTGLNANATTTIVVNAAYTGIPSGTYAVGTVLNFAGLSWKVMADNGTTDILVLNSISQVYQIYTSYGFVSNLDSWLSSNATLLQAKNDGGLVSMSFYVGEINFNGYIRIPTYAEANADYNGPKLWYNIGMTYWTSTVAYSSTDIYGSIRNYYIVYSTGINSGPETSSCSYSGCIYTSYTNGVRPVITVKEQQ